MCNNYTYLLFGNPVRRDALSRRLNSHFYLIIFNNLFLSRVPHLHAVGCKAALSSVLCKFNLRNISIICENDKTDRFGVFILSVVLVKEKYTRV